MSEIQIQFPEQGVWNNFVLTSIYVDSFGYTNSKTYYPKDIPLEQQSALVNVVSALVTMAEPWQAVQVWARLVETHQEDSVEPIEAISLTVEAVNEYGGRRVFTENDYPQFIISDISAINFFKSFNENTR